MLEKWQNSTLFESDLDAYPSSMESESGSMEIESEVWAGTAKYGDHFSLTSGDLAFFEEGVLHNSHGPAISRSNGDAEYWLWGVRYEDYESYSEDAAVARSLEEDFAPLRTVFDGHEHRVAPVLSNFANGEQRSTINGSLHDIAGPAIYGPADYEGYYSDGLAHREDGPAVVASTTTKAWAKNGIISREDGPAIEFSNGVQWYIKDGKFHRTDGPAVVGGSKDEYWVDGKQMTEDEFNEMKTLSEPSSEDSSSYQTYFWHVGCARTACRPAPLP